MTTFYEGSDLDEWLAHFFANVQARDAVKKVLSVYCVEDFESLPSIYEDPTQFHLDLQKEDPRAFNLARRNFAKAAFLTKEWENEPFAQTNLPPPPPPELKRIASLPSQTLEGRGLLDNLIEANERLPCVERTASIIFEHLRAKQKNPCIDLLERCEINKLVDELNKYGEEENLKSESSHSFNTIWSVGIDSFEASLELLKGKVDCRMADIDNLVSQVRTRSGGEFQNKLQVLKSFLNIKENINLILFDKSITELSLASQESTVDLDSKKAVLNVNKKWEEIKSLHEDFVKNAVSNWETNVMNVIRPMNLSDVHELLVKAEEVADSIQGKDIVLLLGKTGAGKSTTSHFLAGKKMVQVLYGRTLTHHIYPEKTQELEALYAELGLEHSLAKLESFICLPSSNSVTSTINSVEIPFLSREEEAGSNTYVRQFCSECECRNLKNCKSPNCCCINLEVTEEGSCNNCDHDISSHIDDSLCVCGHSHLTNPKSLILVDTAGFEDNRSVEIDISNSISMTKALQGARSIKLLVLLGNRAMGDRLDGWRKNVLQVVADIFPSIVENLYSITYLFTRFSINQRGEVENPPPIDITVHDLNTGLMKDLVVDLQRKRDSGDAVFINPLVTDPNSLQRDDPKAIEILRLKLDQWKKLSVISSLPKWASTYRCAQSELLQFLKSTQENVKRELKLCFGDSSSQFADPLEQCLHGFRHLLRLESVRLDHINVDLSNNNSAADIVGKHLSDLREWNMKSIEEDLSQRPVNSQGLLLTLNKMQFLVKKGKDMFHSETELHLDVVSLVEDPFIEACRRIRDAFKEMNSQLDSTIDAKNFGESVALIISLENFTRLLAEHLNDESINLRNVINTSVDRFHSIIKADSQLSQKIIDDHFITAKRGEINEEELLFLSRTVEEISRVLNEVETFPSSSKTPFRLQEIQSCLGTVTQGAINFVTNSKNMLDEFEKTSPVIGDCNNFGLFPVLKGLREFITHLAGIPSLHDCINENFIVLNEGISNVTIECKDRAFEEWRKVVSEPLEFSPMELKYLLCHLFEASHVSSNSFMEVMKKFEDYWTKNGMFAFNEDIIMDAAMTSSSFELTTANAMVYYISGLLVECLENWTIDVNSTEQTHKVPLIADFIAMRHRLIEKGKTFLKFSDEVSANLSTVVESVRKVCEDNDEFFSTMYSTMSNDLEGAGFQERKMLLPSHQKDFSKKIRYMFSCLHNLHYLVHPITNSDTLGVLSTEEAVKKIVKRSTHLIDTKLLEKYTWLTGDSAPLPKDCEASSNGAGLMYLTYALKYLSDFDSVLKGYGAWKNAVVIKISIDRSTFIVQYEAKETTCVVTRDMIRATTSDASTEEFTEGDNVLAQYDEFRSCSCFQKWQGTLEKKKELLKNKLEKGRMDHVEAIISNNYKFVRALARYNGYLIPSRTSFETLESDFENELASFMSGEDNKIKNGKFDRALATKIDGLDDRGPNAVLKRNYISLTNDYVKAKVESLRQTMQMFVPTLSYKRFFETNVDKVVLAFQFMSRFIDDAETILSETIEAIVELTESYVNALENEVARKVKNSEFAEAEKIISKVTEIISSAERVDAMIQQRMQEDPSSEFADVKVMEAIGREVNAFCQKVSSTLEREKEFMMQHLQNALTKLKEMENVTSPEMILLCAPKPQFWDGLAEKYLRGVTTYDYVQFSQEMKTELKKQFDIVCERAKIGGDSDICLKFLGEARQLPRPEELERYFKESEIKTGRYIDVEKNVIQEALTRARQSTSLDEVWNILAPIIEKDKDSFSTVRERILFMYNTLIGNLIAENQTPQAITRLSSEIDVWRDISIMSESRKVTAIPPSLSEGTFYPEIISQVISRLNDTIGNFKDVADYDSSKILLLNSIAEAVVTLPEENTLRKDLLLKEANIMKWCNKTISLTKHFFETHNTTVRNHIASLTKIVSEPATQMPEINRQIFVQIADALKLLQPYSGSVIESKVIETEGAMTEFVPYVELLARLNEVILTCENTIMNPDQDGNPTDYCSRPETQTVNKLDKDTFYVGIWKSVCIRNAMASLERFSVNQSKSCNPISHIQDQMDKFSNAATKILPFVVEGKDDRFDEFNVAYENLLSIETCIQDRQLSCQASMRKESIDSTIKSLIAGKRAACMIEMQVWNSQGFKFMDHVKTKASDFKSLKALTNRLVQYKSEINRGIDDVLEEYVDRGEQGTRFVNQLALELLASKNDGGVGRTLVDKHPVFQAAKDAFTSLIFDNMNIKDMVEGLRVEPAIEFSQRDNWNRDLINLHKVFMGNLSSDIDKVMSREQSIEDLVQQAKDKTLRVEKDRADVCDIMTKVCAVWALSEVVPGREIVFRKPHKGQFLCVVQLLQFYAAPASSSSAPSSASILSKAASFVFASSSSSSSSERVLRNHFTELGTGEGKSIVLAVTSIILALYGYEVDCCCYSKYLSTRDFNAFEKLFRIFQVEDKIVYGTFSERCEAFVNANVDVRLIVEKSILIAPSSGGKKGKKPTPSRISSPNKRVLIIDEVDAFLNPESYGKQYNIGTRVPGNKYPQGKNYAKKTIREYPHIKELIKFVWSLEKEIRGQPGTTTIANDLYQRVRASAEYQNLLREYDHCKGLLEELVRQMVLDLTKYETQPPYEVRDGKLWYQDGDTQSDTISIGYQTMFAYFRENEKDPLKISETNLEANMGLLINSGAFAFSEIPKMYTVVLGVTGTLATLNDVEMEYLHDNYNIRNFSYVPSVYGNIAKSHISYFNKDKNLSLSYNLKTERWEVKSQGSVGQPLATVAVKQSVSLGSISAKWTIFDASTSASEDLKITITLARGVFSLSGHPSVEGIYEVNAQIGPRPIRPNLNFPFNSLDYCLVRPQSEHFQFIRNEINRRSRQPGSSKLRAVLVFFKTRKELANFREWIPASDALKSKAYVLTEDTPLDDRQDAVDVAVIAGNVTLLTRELGRGTDFSSQDDEMEDIGGIHVIQTFLSEEVSEEVQVMGRTARMGKKGSFSMVLCEEELEVFDIKPLEIEAARQSGELYTFLDEKRKIFFGHSFDDKLKDVAAIMKNHEDSQQFLADIFDNKNAEAMGYLRRVNKTGVSAQGTFSRTVVLIDATGSMGSTLQAAKDTVMIMFDHLIQTLEIEGLEEGAFEMMIGLYRNYSSREQVFTHSEFSSKSDVLRAWLQSNGIHGGQGREAVEVGLQFVNSITSSPALPSNASDPPRPLVTQVILIGDIGPNTQAEVTNRRQGVGGDKFWSNTPFKTPCYWETEVAALKQKKIPVHTFFVDSRDAENNFRQIATRTAKDGETPICEYLDTKSSAGAEMLKDHVSKRVMFDVGENSGKGGDHMIDAYLDNKRKQLNI